MTNPPKLLAYPDHFTQVITHQAKALWAARIQPLQHTLGHGHDDDGYLVALGFFLGIGFSTPDAVRLAREVEPA